MEQNQEQKKQGLTSAYNTYVNARAAANLGRVAGKLALQLAARTATVIVMSPVGWIAIGIGTVVVATFLIVFSIGAPSFPSDSEEETPATTATTEFSITPNPLSPTPTTEPTTTPSPTPTIF